MGAALQAESAPSGRAHGSRLVLHVCCQRPDLDIDIIRATASAWLRSQDGGSRTIKKGISLSEKSSVSLSQGTGSTAQAQQALTQCCRAW